MPNFSNNKLLIDEYKELVRQQVNVDDLTFEEDYAKSKNIDERKRIGQYFTPKSIALLMAKLLIKEKSLKRTISILDPSIGPGILISELLKELEGKNKEISNLSITGFDIDSQAIELAELRLKEICLNQKANLVLKNTDFLIDQSTESYDFIICNPPYIKSNRIKNKSRLFNTIKNRYFVDLDGTTGLDSLFLIKSINLLNSKGKLVFIMPSEFLNSGFGEKIKQYLLDFTILERLIYFNTKEFVFEDGMSSAVIIVANRKKEEEIDYSVQFISLDSVTEETLQQALLADGSRVLSKNELDPTIKWANYFLVENKFIQLFSTFVPLSNYFKCKRGLATGSNKFFTVNQSSIQKFSIPKNYLKKVLPKAFYANPPIFDNSNFENLRKQDKPVFLLKIEEEFPVNVDKYLQYGLELGVDKKYLTRMRKKWFFTETRKPAQILVKVFNREANNFILNETDCLNLTCFHGIYIPDQYLHFSKFLVIYFNSEIGQKAISQQLRNYSGGLRKLEPRDVEKILIPRLEEFTTKELEDINLIFDRWKKNKKMEEEDGRSFLNIVRKKKFMKSSTFPKRRLTSLNKYF